MVAGSSSVSGKNSWYNIIDFSLDDNNKIFSFFEFISKNFEILAKAKNLWEAIKLFSSEEKLNIKDRFLNILWIKDVDTVGKQETINSIELVHISNFYNLLESWFKIENMASMAFYFSKWNSSKKRDIINEFKLEVEKNIKESKLLTPGKADKKINTVTNSEIPSFLQKYIKADEMVDKILDTSKESQDIEKPKDIIEIPKINIDNIVPEQKQPQNNTVIDFVKYKERVHNKRHLASMDFVIFFFHLDKNDNYHEVKKLLPNFFGTDKKIFLNYEWDKNIKKWELKWELIDFRNIAELVFDAAARTEFFNWYGFEDWNRLYNYMVECFIDVFPPSLEDYKKWKINVLYFLKEIFSKSENEEDFYKYFKERFDWIKEENNKLLEAKTM